MTRRTVAFVIALLAPFQLAIAQTPPSDSVLPNRPDVTSPTGAQKPEGKSLLGETFESMAAGITFSVPAGWKEIRNRAGSEVVQFVDEEKRRAITVNRLSYDPPVEMTMHQIPNTNGKGMRDKNGLFEETIDRLTTDTPGIEIDRKEVVQVPTADGWTMDVGFIAGRYKSGTENNIALIALLRTSMPDKNTKSAGRVYYSFNLNAVVPKDVKLEDSAEVRELAATFYQMVDSVKLLDQTPIRDEQNRRLFATRGLFATFKKPELLENALVPQQWLRLQKDGKDIGYSYIVEEIARDLPRGGDRGAVSNGPDGFLIGVRTRTLPTEGTQVNSESWMWSSFDRKFEKWTTFSQVQDQTAGEDRYQEVGSVNTLMKLVRERRGNMELDSGEQINRDESDPGQPPMRQAEVSTLEVYSKGKQRTAPSQFVQQLAPWYLPKAMTHLLPRLVVKNGEKSYMFATYDSDNHAVMARYVDVGTETGVTLDGRSLRVIPVKDRIGLEGSVTTHYISPQGVYLGSVNEDSKITIIATDRETLEKLWKNADLTPPRKVEEKP